MGGRLSKGGGDSGRAHKLSSSHFTLASPAHSHSDFWLQIVPVYNSDTQCHFWLYKTASSYLFHCLKSATKCLYRVNVATASNLFICVFPDTNRQTDLRGSLKQFTYCSRIETAAQFCTMAIVTYRENITFEHISNAAVRTINKQLLQWHLHSSTPAPIYVILTVQLTFSATLPFFTVLFCFIVLFADAQYINNTLLIFTQYCYWAVGHVNYYVIATCLLSCLFFSVAT